MRVTIAWSVCIFLLGIFAGHVNSQNSGRVLYVNRTDQTCAGQLPCYATIQAAIDASTAKDTVRIQSGVYAGQLTIQKNDFVNANETDRIVIESDPSADPGSVVLTGSAGPQCTDKFAIRLKQSRFITIRDLVITGTGGQAIVLMGGNNGIQGIHIVGNRVFRNGSNSCDGGIQIARNNPDSVIVNTIYSNGWNGVNVARPCRNKRPRPEAARRRAA